MTRLRAVVLAVVSALVVLSVVLFLIHSPGQKLNTRVLPHEDGAAQGVVYGRVTNASGGGEGGYHVMLLHHVDGQDEVDSETSTASDGTYTTAGPAVAGTYVVRFTSPDESLQAEREVALQPSKGVRVDAQVASERSLLILFPIFAY